MGTVSTATQGQLEQHTEMASANTVYCEARQRQQQKSVNNRKIREKMRQSTGFLRAGKCFCCCIPVWCCGKRWKDESGGITSSCPGNVPVNDNSKAAMRGNKNQTRHNFKQNSITLSVISLDFMLNCFVFDSVFQLLVHVRHTSLCMYL